MAISRMKISTLCLNGQKKMWFIIRTDTRGKAEGPHQAGREGQHVPSVSRTKYSPIVGLPRFTLRLTPVLRVCVDGARPAWVSSLVASPHNSYPQKSS